MTAMKLAEHWDGVYAPGEETRNWHQDAPAPLLELRRRAGIGPDTALIDVGGVASPLARALHVTRERPFVDLPEDTFYR